MEQKRVPVPESPADGDSAERRPPPLGLVDGAAGAWTTVPAELDSLRAIVSDSSQPLTDRIEAYEDIID